VKWRASVGTRVGLFLGAYFAANAINTFLPLWFSDRGLSGAAIGQVLGIAALLRVLAGPGWGSLADYFGHRRPVLVAAAGTAALMALLYLPCEGYVPLLLVAAGQGIAASAVNPLVDSLALALAREARMEYGPVRSFGSIAYMVATAAAGWLLGAAGSWLVPWLLGASYGAASSIGPFLPEARVPPATTRVWAGLALFRVPGFRLAVAGTALIQGAHAAYYGFATLFWRSQGYSDRTIGLLIAEGIVMEILLFARGRRLITRLGPAGLTACAATASVVRWCTIAAAPPPGVLAMVQVLHAATFAMQHLSAMIVLTRVVPPERAATAQALHSALGYGAPTGLMMLAAGALYARSGGSAFLAMAAIAGTALALVRPLARAVPTASGPSGFA
jgi:PPP family 3-phenylpropionic acid transporter